MPNLATRLFSKIKNFFNVNPEPIVFTKDEPSSRQQFNVSKNVTSPLPDRQPEPKPTPTPEPKKSFLGSFLRPFSAPSQPIVFERDTPSPTPIPTFKPTPTPQPQRPAPTPAPVFTESQPGNLGRSEKFKALYSPQTQGTVDTIVSAANQVGVRPDLLLDIAAQESALGNLGPNNPDLRTSGFHPTARSASGVFQFTAPTWAEGVRRYAKELGIEPISAEPYTDEWLRQIDQYRLDPRLNSLMAAMFIRDGMLSRWNASKNVWGNVYSDEELRPYLN